MQVQHTQQAQTLDCMEDLVGRVTVPNNPPLPPSSVAASKFMSSWGGKFDFIFCSIE